MTREQRKKFTLAKKLEKKQAKKDARELDKTWRDFLKRMELKGALITESN